MGTGSFGKAYLVKERRNGKQWVIKQINIADMSSSEQENVQK